MSLSPGRFIDKKVAKQIEKRQEVIGGAKRLFGPEDPEAYSFFLAKTPFIKLTSGIDKGGSQDPAKQSVLDNGYRGIASDRVAEAPGYEYSDDFGVRPAAGIIGMTLKTHNRYGSLRTATVQFEVHSLEQMNLYEEMFMRPGYSALLEWGHSVYIDSTTGNVYDMAPLLSEPFINKELVSSFLNTKADSDAIENQSKQAIYAAIEKMRRRTDYNYDGMYGLIKNFSWSLRADGGYSCTVDIVSIGTVIESLTLNANMLASEVLHFYNLEDEDRKEMDVVMQDRPPPFTFFPGTGDEAEGTTVQNAILEGIKEQLPTINAVIDKRHPFKAVLKENLKRNIVSSKNYDYRIVWAVDTSDSPYRVHILGACRFLPIPNWFFGDEKRYEVIESLTTMEGLEVYQQFNNLEIKVKVDNGTYEYFRLKHHKTTFLPAITNVTRKGIEKYPDGIPLEKLKDTLEKDDKISHLQGNSIFNLSQIADPNATPPAADQEAQEDAENDQTAESETDIRSVQTILNTSKQFTSRIHLALFLLKRRIGSNISTELKGPEAPRVYQEFQVDLDFAHNVGISSEYNVAAVRRRLGEATTDSFHYYIQLGTFLDILNKYIPQSRLKNKKTVVTEALFQFNTSKKNTHLYKTLEDLHASVDITKCILPDSYAQFSKEASRGDILEIFIETDYLFGLVEKGLVNGDLKGYDLVNEILRDINLATGQINELALQFHEESFTFHIVDRKLVGNKFSAKTEVALNLIGKNTILRNVTMNSKLSPSISTQIAISAQADPTSNGIEGTLFERFNAGLLDRYIPEKKTDFDRLLQAQRDKREQKEKDCALAIGYLLKVYGPPSFVALQQTLPGVINEYALMTKELLLEEGEDRSYGGILPFELGLEIEGISGMQVMDSFLINQNILPKSYVGGGNFGFLITGLTQKVDSNGWVTEVRSQIYNRPTGAREAAVGELTFDTTSFKGTKPVNEKNLKNKGQGHPDLAIISGFYSTETDNNPYNLRPLGTAVKFNGVTGQKAGFRAGMQIGYFLVFDTLENGVRAGMKNLVTGYFRKNINTVDEIIKRYAPPFDFNDTTSYITNVTFRMQVALQGTSYSGITKDTVLEFEGATETKPDNITMFRELNKAILLSEGGTSASIATVLATVDSFQISNLA
jgi:hypothetical protein